MIDHVQLYDTYLQTAVQAAHAAGEIISAAFSKPKSVILKGAVDLVTETDKAAEALIMAALQDAFPSHQFIGEEGSAEQGFASELTDEPTWMCDPLDGTTNFVHSFPFVCVSIALVINKKAVVGVVYNPVMKELFTAVTGRGATLNGNPISCSNTTSLGSALLATEVGTSRSTPTLDAIFTRVRTLTSAMRAVRCCGSCALNLCGVACGRLDAFYEVGFGGCWDAAAGALVVTEAGGAVSDTNGAEFDVMGRRVLASNRVLAPALMQLLAGCVDSPEEPPRGALQKQQ
ncbi:MAG: hypothetical protein WDW36_000475 [Sanguina aurantia]